MLARTLGLALLTLAVPAAGTVTVLAPHGPSEVSFPADFATGVLYATFDRADTRQRLEVFAPREAIAAAKRGEALPDGTVLTMLRFKARLDAAGQPQRDADGGFVKAELAGYTVMEKRRGWGVEHPAPLRNGEWAFRRYTPTREIDRSIGQVACMQCHVRRGKDDFIFSRAKMLAVDPERVRLAAN
jgi:hypothetical protein